MNLLAILWITIGFYLCLLFLVVALFMDKE